MKTLPSDRDLWPQNIFATAVAFEGGLVVVALLGGYLCGYPLIAAGDLTRQSLPGHGAAVLWGVAAVVPMVVGLLLIDRYPQRCFRRLGVVVRRLIVPLFAGCRWWQLAVISALAGIGEEMLFRGLLQAGLAAWIGPPYGLWIGLTVASVAFGLAHWLTTSYLVLATLTGLYLGLLLYQTDHLLAPIVAHAVYDFIALTYLVARHRR